MPEPRPQSRRPRIPSPLYLSKDHPGIRGYAKPRCSAGKRRVIVAMAVGNKPLFAALRNINHEDEIVPSTLRVC
jgi:hypothetical protein